MSTKNRIFFYLALILAILIVRNRTITSPQAPEAEPVEPRPTPSLVERGIEAPIDLNALPTLPPPPAVAPAPALPTEAAQVALDWRSWLRSSPPADPQLREEWVARGMELAKSRRTEMAEWIEEDPRRALEAALTPRQYAALPAEVQALVERPVAGEGFYGVLAICGHGPEEDHIEGACRIEHEVVFNFGTFDAEFYKAAIYGAREQKLTVENDAIYGVALDDRIALHEDGAVIVDDGEGAEGGRFALYYRDTVSYSDDLDALKDLRETLLTRDAE